jgi:hypothetical protein
MPMIVAVTDSKGRWVADFHSAIDSGNTSPGNAVFIKEKGEYPRVYSLALARLKRVLI